MGHQQITTILNRARRRRHQAIRRRILQTAILLLSGLALILLTG